MGSIIEVRLSNSRTPDGPARVRPESLARLVGATGVGVMMGLPIALLRQIEVASSDGKLAPHACREVGITEQSYYRWPGALVRGHLLDANQGLRRTVG
jgi:hypothetical protein